MKKIGAILPVYNNAVYLKAQLEMLKNLDKIVVLFGQSAFPTYKKEHQYSDEKTDNSEEIIKEAAKTMPNLFYYNSNLSGDPTDELHGEGSKYVLDCDIVYTANPDSFFTKVDWDRILTYIQINNFDWYALNLPKCSVNYYLTGSFEHGIKDAEEPAVTIFWDPKLDFSYNMRGNNPCHIFWDDFIMHHFKGWKKSCTKEWIEGAGQEYRKKYGNNGEWFKAPQEIINAMK